MAYYCPRCGAEMVKDDYDDEYYCDDCMCYFSITPGQEKFFEDPNTYLIQDKDARGNDLAPAGCRACGNPNYPNCIDSCPLMDD